MSRYDDIYPGFARALNGLPPDIAALGFDQLVRRKVVPDSAYRLPMLTSDEFDGFAGAAGANVPMSFVFPTLGVIFGISRRVVGFQAGEDISDLDFVLTDASSNKPLIGTAQIPANLSQIPDPEFGTSPYVRLSPVTATSTVNWTATLRVRNGITIVGPLKGAISLFGIGFWVSGEQIVG